LHCDSGRRIGFGVDQRAVIVRAEHAAGAGDRKCARVSTDRYCPMFGTVPDMDVWSGLVNKEKERAILKIDVQLYLIRVGAHYRIAKINLLGKISGNRTTNRCHFELYADILQSAGARANLCEPNITKGVID